MTRLPSEIIAKAVLGSLAGAGLLTVAMAGPNVFQILKLVEGFNRKKHRRYQSPAYLRTVAQRLKRQGLVRVYEKNCETVMEITEKGRRKLEYYQFREKKTKKRKWDGKWRMIIFDIKENVRLKRDYLRQDMRDFGLVHLQDSVWVYPYECEEIIDLLKAQYGIGSELLYVVAAEIENDARLKKKFHLK